MSNIDKQALVIPQREKHDWSQAVMRDCDFCQQWALTVWHSDGGCICASCCDSEYTTALSSALVVALDELEAKDKRCAALAAENASLKDSVDHAAGCIHAAEVEGLIDALGEKDGERLADLIHRRLCHAYLPVETPATDAFLAEVRAQGVDMAACALDDVNQFNYANMLDDLAQKIRKGVI